MVSFFYPVYVVAITTAGSEGFLRLLPIYLDHILYPTLTESGYHTEVHHINGKGEDAGVREILLFRICIHCVLNN